MTTPAPAADRWQSAWLDAVAFVTVLAVAWWVRASATDLVWSLWLSSLVVGYAIILWAVVRPALTMGAFAWRDRAMVKEALRAADPRTALLVGALGLVGALFVVAFFTVHFGGFHYVHAQFLGMFFPLTADYDGGKPLQGAAMFAEVLRRYWIFVPSAFLAERGAFTGAWKASAKGKGSVMMLPYQKVMRMHALIFFFGAAHFARLDNFAVYAVVYAVYFFPWRLVSRRSGVIPHERSEGRDLLSRPGS